jgi:hypothetical protein
MTGTVNDGCRTRLRTAMRASRSNGPRREGDDAALGTVSPTQSMPIRTPFRERPSRSAIACRATSASDPVTKNRRASRRWIRSSCHANMASRPAPDRDRNQAGRSRTKAR